MNATISDYFRISKSRRRLSHTCKCSFLV